MYASVLASYVLQGWYWKVTDQETGASFALIFSVEDPAGGTHTGVSVFHAAMVVFFPLSLSLS